MKQNCVSPDFFAIQATFVPLMLGEIYKRLQKSDINGLLDYTDDMALTTDMIKEHLMCLDLSNEYE